MRILAVADTVIVAICILAVVAGIVITSIIRYRADDFVKFWAAAGTVIGLALGGVGTFFFTKGEVEQKQAQVELKQTEATKAAEALKVSEKEKAEIGDQINQFVQYISADPAIAARLKEFATALTTAPPDVYHPENSPQLAVSPAPKDRP